MNMVNRIEDEIFVEKLIAELEFPERKIYGAGEDKHIVDTDQIETSLDYISWLVEQN